MKRERIKEMKEIVTNPLITGCVAATLVNGVIYKAVGKKYGGHANVPFAAYIGMVALFQATTVLGITASAAEYNRRELKKVKA